MNYEDFLANVREEAGLDSPEEAEKIVRATFETLAERLGRAERGRLADQLPLPLKEFLESDAMRPSWYDLEEFYNRVGARADLGQPEAIRQARCVVSVLTMGIPEGEVQKVLAELPAEFEELLSGPQNALSPTMDSSEFREPEQTR